MLINGYDPLLTHHGSLQLILAASAAPVPPVDVPVAAVAFRAPGAVRVAVVAGPRVFAALGVAGLAALPAAIVRVGPRAELVAVAAAPGPAAVVERLAVPLAAGAVEVRVLPCRGVAVFLAFLFGAAEADFLLHERCVKLHTTRVQVNG